MNLKSICEGPVFNLVSLSHSNLENNWSNNIYDVKWHIYWHKYHYYINNQCVLHSAYYTSMIICDLYMVRICCVWNPDPQQDSFDPSVRSVEERVVGLWGGQYNTDTIQYDTIQYIIDKSFALHFSQQKCNLKSFTKASNNTWANPSSHLLRHKHPPNHNLA